jgi:peroxiredoxin
MAGQVGDPAPDFTLTSSANESVSLGQYKGTKNVILSFHIFNFTSG